MDWVLDEELGRGGMGVVWRARPRTGGEAVALKLVRADVEVDADAFLQEAAAVARLHHPTLVAVYDFGGRDDRPWMAMELLPGGSLAEHPPRDWAGVHDLCRTLLDALAHAHARGLVHRDLKPQNVLRDRSGHWRLVDFGVAQAVGASAVRAGTLPFMAPEQLLGLGAEIGPWTDLYALGILVWQLVTGTLPRVGSPSEILALAQQGTLPPLQPRFAVPDSLAGWLQGLLAPSVDARFQAAADALWGLKQLDVVASTPPASWTPLQGAATLTLEDLDAGALDLPTDEVRSAALPPIPRQLRDAMLAPVVPTNLGLGLLGLRQRPLVGRIAERRRLWQELVAVHDEGRPRHVSVAGPPGSGRSRLLAWLGERAEELGAAVTLRLDVDPHQAAARRLLRLPAPPDRVAQRLARLLDPAELHAWTEETPRSTAALIAAASRYRPVVLLLDDVPEDDQAWAIAERVLALPDARVLVVTVHDGLGDADGIALDWLPDGTVHRLLTLTLGLHPALADVVAREAAGSPRYAVGRVTRWAEEGQLEATSQGLVRRDAPEASPDPGTPQDPGLEIAACLGSAIPLDEWRAACAEAGVEARLPAAHADLIVTDTTLRFASSEPRDRWLARSRAAGTLERWHLACARVVRDPLHVAEHFVAAGALEEALEPMARAAWQRTVGGSSRIVGAVVYERTVALQRQLGRPLREIAETLGWEAWARFQAGDLDGAESRAREVAALADSLEDPGLEASAAHTLAVVARVRGEELLDLLEQAHAGYVLAGDEHAGSIEELIHIETMTPEQRVAVYEERLQERSDVADALSLLRALLAAGRYEDVLSRMAGIQERLDLSLYDHLVSHMTSSALAGAGDLDAAEAEIHRVLASVADDVAQGRLMNEMLLGAIAAERGELHQARHILHLVLERGARTLRVTHMFTIRLFLAAHAGDAAAFDAVLHGEAPRARRQDLFASIGWMLVRGAAAWRRHGDEARARLLEDLRLRWGGWA